MVIIPHNDDYGNNNNNNNNNFRIIVYGLSIRFRYQLIKFDLIKETFTPDGGRDSSVGIATRYGMDGPGIESRWGRHFPNPSRPALGPTQPPVQWVPDLSRG